MQQIYAVRTMKRRTIAQCLVAAHNHSVRVSIIVKKITCQHERILQVGYWPSPSGASAADPSLMRSVAWEKKMERHE